MKKVKATAAGMVLSAISFGIFSAESESAAMSQSEQISGPAAVATDLNEAVSSHTKNGSDVKSQA